MKLVGNVMDSVKSFCRDIQVSSHGFCERIPEAVNVRDLTGNRLEILLLDVSGSMGDTDYSPSRLAGAKQASISFVERVAELNPRSAVAVISFSGTASVVLTPVSAKDGMASFKGAIDSLETDGSTNMPAGLRLSEEVIQKSNTVSPRILLLTDGHSNEESSPVPVAERLKSLGVQIDIIGIGGSPMDVNELELTTMASVVNGETRYWFIRSVGELVKKFENLAIREIK